ncbi:MAG: riboflavin synthase [Candidatus Eremiobacteraeota bacterium]|nr:riboflavin synthase [Candidatus Eremiobacteraeota bacterium]
MRSAEPAVGGLRIAIVSPGLARRCACGDSIAVNGVCLTVTHISEDALSFDVIPETLARSNLSRLKAGDAANVETSLRVGEPLGGHLVYGHVDATTVIASKTAEGQGCRLWCATPSSVSALIVEKGYVALDGASLTVAGVLEDCFSVALIPETIKRTTLGLRQRGDLLNVEVDPVARYVAGVLAHRMDG